MQRLHHLFSKAIVKVGLSRQLGRLQDRKRIYQQITDAKPILEWQLDAFNRRWVEACVKYRFYAEWKRANGLPDRLERFEQLQNFPVLRKTDIQTNFEMIARDAEPCSFISTGGSTGQPTRFPRVKSDLEWIYSSMYLGRSWWGINPADQIMLIWGHSHLFGTGTTRGLMKARRNLMDWMVNTKRLDAYRLDDLSLALHWRNLVRHPGSYIVCYTSVIRRLLDYLEDNQVDGRIAKIRGVILTSETIDAIDIERIRRHMDAPTIIEYGMGETGVLAYSKPTSNSLHFFWDAFHSYVGADDELIISTLHDTRFPLINYGTEDRIEGVESVVPLVCKSIRGRVFDFLALTMKDGSAREVYGDLFTHILKLNPSLRSFFVHQKSRQIDVYLRYADSEELERHIPQILHELEVEYPSVDTSYIHFHHLHEDVRTVAGKQCCILREPADVASPGILPLLTPPVSFLLKSSAPAAETRKKRIVLFYKALVNPGGAERLMLQEWLQLRRLGHDVKILSFYADSKALYGMDKELAADLYVCPGKTWLGKMVHAYSFLIRFKCEAIILTSGIIELFFLTRFRPVPYLVHHHQPCSMSLQEYLKFSWLFRQHFEWLCNRTPAGAQFRDIKASLNWRQRLSYDFRSLLFKYVIDRARFILVMSKYAKTEAERLFRAPVVNLQGALDADAVQRYRDVAPFDDAVGHPLILTVARLDPNKRIDVGIHAFASIARSFPHAQYVVIGSGAERERLDALIAELGLQGRCRLLGYVDEETLKRWYKTCDVFVTVDWADFRLTAFEAWAAGKQVILADEAEVNDDLAATGFVSLTAPEPARLAKAIEAALDRRSKLDERVLGPVLERYTWESYVTKIADLLR